MPLTTLDVREEVGDVVGNHLNKVHDELPMVHYHRLPGEASQSARERLDNRETGPADEIVSLP